MIKDFENDGKVIIMTVDAPERGLKWKIKKLVNSIVTLMRF